MEKMRKIKADFTKKDAMLLWTDENTRESTYIIKELTINYLSTNTPNPDLIILLDNDSCCLGYDDGVGFNVGKLFLVLNKETVYSEKFGEVIKNLVKDCTTEILLFRTNRAVYIAFSLNNEGYFVKLFDKKDYPNLFEELKNLGNDK